MKKFLSVLLVVFSVSLISCPGLHDSLPKLTFEEAVQEVYEMTASTLFYSLNGKTPYVTFNKASNGNEIAGLCTDYSIEFAYYWNEVKNYDELYGKAYLALISTGTSNNTILYFLDSKFAPDGTIKFREENNNFRSNANTEAMDGIYRDIIVNSIVYNGKNILHFGNYQRDHIWIVIKIGEDWYDTEPSAWDTSLYDYPPNKISF